MRYVYFALACLMCGSASNAQVMSFAFSGGYSNIQTEHKDGLFYAHSGAYFDGDFTWRVPDTSVPLLLGFGLTGSGYWDSQSGTFQNNGFLYGYTLYSDLSMFEMEARASVPISFGQRNGRGFFVMPRIGAGLLIDSYAIDTFYATHYFTGAAFEVRPTLQVGYSWGPGSAGAEFSYMAAWGDFGQLGSWAQELRAGAFIRFKF